EGLLAVVEHLQLSDLAVGERENRQGGHLHRRTAGASNLALAEGGQNLVARVYQLLDFEIDLAEGGEPIAPELPHTFVSVVDRLRKQHSAPRVPEVPDDVLGVHVEGGHVVTPGGRLVDPAHYFNVLLRHRSRSISPGTAAFHGACCINPTRSRESSSD